MTEYNLAWIVYVAASAVLMLLFYLLTQRLKPVVLAVLLRCLVAALLITPAAIKLPGATEAWSPAFIAIVIEFMSGQTELAQSRIQSLTSVTLGLFLLALLLRYLIAKLSSKSAAE